VKTKTRASWKWFPHAKSMIPSTNIIYASHGRESKKYRIIVIFYGPPVSPVSTQEKII